MLDRLLGEGFDTLGGFVLQRLGRIPSPTDRVEHDGVSVDEGGAAPI